MNRSGDLELSVALKFFDYLDKEMDYVPWYVASNEFGYINLMLSLDPLYGKLSVSSIKF